MFRLTIIPMLVLLPAIILPCPSLKADEKAPAKRIDVEQFDKMRHDKDTVVLDVRTKQEYDQGHVPGSTNIDINDPQFRKKIGELDHSKTYLVHCASGVRSDRACPVDGPSRPGAQAPQQRQPYVHRGVGKKGRSHL